MYSPIKIKKNQRMYVKPKVKIIHGKRYIKNFK